MDVSAKAKSSDGGGAGSDRVIENRRAHFEYFIAETVECGLVLFGPEVKSIRAGQVSIAEGYVRAEQHHGKAEELWLLNANIADYGPAGPAKDKPTRARKLLAHRKEITRLWKASQVKGNTLVPLKLYFKNGFAKLLIGVGTGKKQHDKRESLKEKDAARDISRAMSRKA
ncbi:SsrA-binding protein [soil metagenome]